MTRIATLALMIGAICGTSVSQQAAEFSSYYSSNRYDFRLTHKQLLSTPAWLEDEPNPPLSPRTAQSAALSYLRTLFDNAPAWRLEEIKLVPLIGRWVYVVSYTTAATQRRRLHVYAFQHSCHDGRNRHNSGCVAVETAKKNLGMEAERLWTSTTLLNC